jgi:hypothetical protein
MIAARAAKKRRAPLDANAAETAARNPRRPPGSVGEGARGVPAFAVWVPRPSR